MRILSAVVHVNLKLCVTQLFIMTGKRCSIINAETSQMPPMSL